MNIMHLIESPILLEIPEGKTFLKEVIYEGSFAHPQDPKEKMVITKERMQNWVQNFKAGIPDIVYVPLNHSAKPTDNTGVVKDLFLAPSKAEPGKMSLWAKLEVLLDDVIDKIGKTILGCSVGVEDYTDPKTGKEIGEVVSHIALTNEPYIQHLSPFQLAFSRNEIKNYVIAEKPQDKDSEEPGNKILNRRDNMLTEEEIKAMKEKMERLEAEKKEVEKSLEAEKKAKTELEAEKVKIEQAAFEKEMTSEVDKLVTAGAVLPADKDEVTKTAIEFGRGKAEKFLKTLEKNKKVDTTTHSTRSSEKTDGKDEVVNLSEFQNIFADGIMNLAKHQRDKFESLKTKWNALCEKASKGVIKCDLTTLYEKDGKTKISAER